MNSPLPLNFNMGKYFGKNSIKNFEHVSLLATVSLTSLKTSENTPGFVGVRDFTSPHPETLQLREPSSSGVTSWLGRAMLLSMLMLLPTTLRPPLSFRRCDNFASEISFGKP